MTDREMDELSPAEARTRETLHTLERPGAESSFRERLKEDFVAGTLGEREPAGRAAGERGLGVSRGLPRVVRRRWPRQVAGPALPWASGLAAAAAFAVVVGVLNAPARWTALPSGGTGSLIVDGVAIPVSQTSEITRRIRPGSRVRLDCVRDLDIVSGGSLAIQLAPGTEVVVPSAPGRWFGRSSTASVESGHFRLTTGDRFRGAQLAIATPDAEIHVTGTTLAVIAEPSGTCVCVLEGVAKVGRHGGDMMTVPAKSRCEIHPGGGDPVMAEMRAEERPKLTDLRDRMAAVLR